MLDKEEYKKYISYQLKELEARYGDKNQIEELKKILKMLDETDTNVSFPKIEQKSKIEEKNKKVEAKKEKRKIKGIKKFLLIGSLIAVGGHIGYKAGYEYASNLPVSHNYTTKLEREKGIEHDDTKYRRYLKEKFNLTDEQIEKRIEEEEKAGRWDREIGDD